MKRIAAMKRTHKILAVAIVMIVIVIAGVAGYMSSISVKPPPTDVNTLVYALSGEFGLLWIRQWLATFRHR